jgi:hypothetical protein
MLLIVVIGICKVLIVSLGYLVTNNNHPLAFLDQLFSVTSEVSISSQIKPSQI